MAAASFTLSIDDRARAALARAPEAFLRELATGILEAQMLVEREVKERTPTSGHGTLRDSIGAMPLELTGSRIAGSVGTALSYAEPVELGTQPHMPPLEPLVDWVRRKLGIKGGAGEQVAQAIRWKIYRHGTKAAFMFRDAFAAVTPQIDAIMGAAVVRAIHTVEGLA